MRSFIDTINQSAKDWNISQRAAWLIIWVPILGAIAVALSRVSLHLYTFVTMEDGPLEWLQFVFYAAAAIFGAGVAFKRFRAGHPWQALLFLGFALGNFFIAGEEIAWGQRIFGLQTPEDLAAINHQGEITVHNILVVQNALNVILLFASLAAVAMYFINKRYQFQNKWDQANYLLVPPLFSASLFLVMFVYKFVRFVFLPDAEFTITKFGEWPELCFAFALFLFAWLNYCRLAVATVVVRPPSSQETPVTK